MSTGTPVSLQLPPHLDTGPEDLVLAGRVLRHSRLTRGKEGRYLMAIRFGELQPGTLKRLEAALASALLEPPEAEAEPASMALPESEEIEAAGAQDRRQQRRVQYERRVIASVRDAMHRILIGRDLSAGGMRIEPHADLRIGDELRVAVYDANQATPLVVEAVVERDDGPAGLVLRFEDVEPIVAERLEALVATLPPVECLEDGETGAIGTVVSEILQPR